MRIATVVVVLAGAIMLPASGSSASAAACPTWVGHKCFDFGLKLTPNPVAQGGRVSMEFRSMCYPPDSARVTSSVFTAPVTLSRVRPEDGGWVFSGTAKVSATAKIGPAAVTAKCSMTSSVVQLQVVSPPAGARPGRTVTGHGPAQVQQKPKGPVETGGGGTFGSA
ncbi:hypothetical protein [Actinocrispum sp. NPDC049592]|uniref:hypothetical protein n=1 Tax=Actinocrispum sp. NPDC049592 TaxID=3154835 RepID=UPI00343D2CEE